MEDEPPQFHDNTDDSDPGNLRDKVDEDALPLLHCSHRALDGGDHYTPEDIERYDADQSMDRKMQEEIL